jgi:hypothetical protein
MSDLFVFGFLSGTFLVGSIQLLVQACQSRRKKYLIRKVIFDELTRQLRPGGLLHRETRR